jgi:Fe-S cluster assembly scaffold protein SufB
VTRTGFGEFRKKALEVFHSKPMPTNWATKDLENIKFDEFRYYLSDGQKPKRSWDEVPEDVKKTFDRLGIPGAGTQIPRRRRGPVRLRGRLFEHQSRCI